MRTIHIGLSLPSIALLIGCVVSTTALADDRVFDEKFAVPSGGTLTVDSDFGAIDISGGDSNEVVVHATLNGDRHLVEDYEITADGGADGVTIRGRRSDDGWDGFSWMFNTLDVSYSIRVPRNYHVRVRSSRGDLEMRNFNGTVNVHVSRGNLSLAGINGAVQIDASRGHVHGKQLVGNVRVAVSRGNVQLQQVNGSLDVRTSRGNVEVDLLNPHAGTYVNTSRGDVVVTLPREFGANLDVRTDRGDVDCDVSVARQERHTRRRGEALSGTLNGGGKLLKVDATRGDVDIRSGS